MFLRFLNFLRESPFIEGMGKILDFRGIIGRNTLPAMSDAEILAADWKKVMRDYKHSIIIIEEKTRDGTLNFFLFFPNILEPKEVWLKILNMN
jgi:hypothetical protein